MAVEHIFCDEILLSISQDFYNVLTQTYITRNINDDSVDSFALALDLESSTDYKDNRIA